MHILYAVNTNKVLSAQKGKKMTPYQFKMAKTALGLSNPELAESVGLHRNTLNKVDKGEAKASTTKLLRLALEAKGVQFLESGQVALGAGVALRERED